MKLEIKHLAAYLPYGLELRYTNAMDYTDTYIIDGAQVDYKGVVWAYMKNKSLPLIDTFNIKLLPLSKLTEEIEHNGEKFIPMERLAMVEQGNWDEGEFILRDGINFTRCYTVKGSDEWTSDCYIVEYKTVLNQIESLSFKDGDFSKIWSPTKRGLIAMLHNNQKMLFDKLHEWHFDLYNLLDNGLAKEK